MLERFYALNVIKDAYKKKSSVLHLTDETVDNFIFIPPEIGHLPLLRELHIRGKNIAKIPRGIGKLYNLNFLLLSSDDLSELPEEIANLTNLKYLWVFGNFSRFPSAILRLENLEALTFISNFTIKYLPNEIGNLQKLIYLDLEVGLNSIPSEIGELRTLKYLKFSGNNLERLPPELGRLSKLEYFSLGTTTIFPGRDEIVNRLAEIHHPVPKSARVTALPLEINNITSLRYLDLRGNSLPIPPEILEKVSDPKSILNYYFSLLGEKKKPLNEIKIIVVGQSSVGKTSIIKRLVKNDFDDSEPITEGISIDRWQVPNKQSKVVNQESKIQLNLWDFGGQEIMHATHQFFLTRRSLYLLILDSRNSQEDNRVEYWLKIIQSFGGESPILIVGNKIDQHPLDIDRTGLQKKYPNIVGILETSAATGAGIEELKAAITEQVNNLPHVRDLLPETWFTVKNELERIGREQNFITHDKYLELCAKNEVSDETSQRTLIGFLHDLGVVLHFQDDPRLEALGILNPKWVTNGVYKIINSRALFQNKGVLIVSMLNEILNLPEYPRDKRLFIVDMMKKFELCYDIESDKKFLVPDLLPKDEPKLNFNGIPAFEYAYPVLPSSVITRFIVRMNKKIDNGYVWRTGVLLKIGDNIALVKADIEDRKITIVIGGLEHTRRDALSAIRYQLDEIHASIKGLNPQKRVPVPGAPNAEPLEYDYLLMLEREGQETHLVKDGARLVKVNVREVLSGIESESQRREQGVNVTNIYIGGNVESSNIISGDNNVVTQRIQNSFNKAEASDIQAELKETLKQLAEAVISMNKSLPEEQAAEVADDLGKLVDEAIKPKPNQKWYSVSIDGLIKAAENLDKLGEPVINLSRKVLSLLKGGVFK
ncbi:MAG: GTP-binding protein [Chloroflexi bacterium]|nr:GTP-binding protein [Chloroflexota bacterium]